MEYLNEVIVDPRNIRYQKYDDKFIIGKSSLENEEFDVLVFCSINVEEVTIPSFIREMQKTRTS